MRVKLLRPVRIAGRVVYPPSVVEVSRELCSALCSAHKAKRTEAEPSEEHAHERPRVSAPPRETAAASRGDTPESPRRRSGKAEG